jgi:hypothetical protein
MQNALRKLFFLLLMVTLSASVNAADIFVSPKGADSNVGTKTSPKQH